jgi:hypothetical protein
LTIDTNYNGFAIPHNILQKLLEAGIIVKPSKYDPSCPFYLLGDGNKGYMHITFTFMDGQKLNLNDYQLWYFCPDGSVKSIIRLDNPIIKYYNEASWVLGGSFLWYMCYSVDYGKKEIGFATSNSIIG